MKIPLNVTFLNTDGIELTKDNLPPEADKKNVLTSREVLVIALTSEFQEDQQNVGNIVQDKLSRFTVYQKLQDAKDHLVITNEQAVYLKPRVARCFGMLVAGPMINIFEGNSVEKDVQPVV